MSRPSRILVAIGASSILLLGACGGGGADPDAAKPTKETPSVSTEGGPGRYSGTTSEDLPVTFTLTPANKITSFELEIMASCTVAFEAGGSGARLNSGEETVTFREDTEADEPFEATVTINKPVKVGPDGEFALANLSGTAEDGAVSGSYELAFSAQLIEQLTCTGGPVTWSASRED